MWYLISPPRYLVGRGGEETPDGSIQFSEFKTKSSASLDFLASTWFCTTRSAMIKVSPNLQSRKHCAFHEDKLQSTWRSIKKISRFFKKEKCRGKLCCCCHTLLTSFQLSLTCCSASTMPAIAVSKSFLAWRHLTRGSLPQEFFSWTGLILGNSEEGKHIWLPRRCPQQTTKVTAHCELLLCANSASINLFAALLALLPSQKAPTGQALLHQCCGQQPWLASYPGPLLHDSLLWLGHHTLGLQALDNSQITWPQHLYAVNIIRVEQGNGFTILQAPRVTRMALTVNADLKTAFVDSAVSSLWRHHNELYYLAFKS